MKDKRQSFCRVADKESDAKAPAQSDVVKSKQTSTDYKKWIAELNDGQPNTALSIANIRYAHRFYEVYASYLQQLAERMTVDLKAAFPDMKGWSRSNLMYMRQSQSRICQKLMSLIYYCHDDL